MALDDIIYRPLEKIIVFVVIETSGNMEGEKIRAVNNGMKEFIVKLKDIQDKSDEALIKIAVLLYSGGANWLTNSPVEISKFQWQDLKTSGTSDISAAFEALKDKLSIKEFLPTFDESFIPVISLICDGTVSKEYENSLNKLKSNFFYIASKKFAVAIGENADKEMLIKFTNSKDRVFEVTEMHKLSEFIKFVRITDPSDSVSSYTTIEEENEYRNDWRKGIKNYKDGRIYKGQFSEGKPHGYGKGIYPDGRVQEGKWEHGKFLG